ncbi:MAG: hypothetical protein LBG87_07955 [Spirochaetaceae bacterium]|jgi:hypothetical protein|nr:hypothetical protein [Spirochaetaceae bacterium]
MRIKYVLSGLVGIIVLFGGPSCTSGPKGPQPSGAVKTSQHNAPEKNRTAPEQTYASAGSAGPEKPQTVTAGVSKTLPEPAAEKRRETERLFRETLALLGRGPVLAQSGAFYFIPLAALAQAGNGISDAPRSLIDELRVDNPFYRKSEELLAAAAALYEDEEYDQSREIILEAQKYALLAEKEVEQQVKINEINRVIANAESLLKEAETMVNQAKTASPKTPAPLQFKEAQIAYAEARSARHTKDWEGVAEAAQRTAYNASETINALTLLLQNAEKKPDSAQNADPKPYPQENAEEVSVPGEWTVFFQEKPGAEPVSPSNETAGIAQTAPKAPAQPPKTTAPAQSNRPATASKPASSPSRTPSPPGLSAAAVSASPRVPGIAGSASSEPPPSVTPNTAAVRRNPAASPVSRPVIADNTPPVPGLYSQNPSAAAAQIPTNTPQVPALPETAPQISARVPAQNSGSPIRNSAIPQFADAESVYSSAPHIASSLGQEEITAPPENTGLRFASQYRVQVWEASSDCLWNIAGKPWVYGNPNKWMELYRANIAKLPNPQNPHLIPPNLVLDIPSISGEARQGLSTWEGIRTSSP